MLRPHNDPHAGTAVQCLKAGQQTRQDTHTHIHTKKQTYSKNGPWNTPPPTLQVAHARCELDIEVKSLTQALSGMGAGIS